MLLAANGPEVFVEPGEGLPGGGGGICLRLLDGDFRAGDKDALLAGDATGEATVGVMGQSSERMQYGEEEGVW